MDRLVQRKPNQALAPFVEILWYYDLEHPADCRDRLLPHGAFELIISLHGASSDDLISGPQTKPMIVEPGNVCPIVGAHFKPGGAAAIFGHSARSFRDLNVPMEDVWSRRARQLHDRLQDAPGPANCLALLELELTRAALETRPHHPSVSLAIQELHQPCQNRRIRDLAEESGLSQRRFIELFTDRIGLTPKLYARIQRFQRTIHLVASQQRIDWAGLACDSGYSDQAHMIRDFREFSGMRPSAYAPRSPDQPNHVALP